VTEHVEVKGSIWTPGVPVLADTPAKKYLLALTGVLLSVALAYLTVTGWRAVQADNYYSEANHQHMGKELSEAKKGYEKALALNPNHAEASFGLGMIEAATDPGRAVELYLRAIAIDPRNADYHAWLAYAYHNELGKTGPAIKSMETAVDLDGQNYQYRLALSAFLVADGQVDRAIRQLEEVVKLAPEIPAAHQKLGDLYSGLGQKEKASSHRAMISK
jgi:anaphase-promoting complex subunit 3